jgi:hypothetical protein
MTSSESEEHAPQSRKRSRRSGSGDGGGKKARGRPRVDTEDATAADVSGYTFFACNPDHYGRKSRSSVRRCEVVVGGARVTTPSAWPSRRDKFNKLVACGGPSDSVERRPLRAPSTY